MHPAYYSHRQVVPSKAKPIQAIRREAQNSLAILATVINTTNCRALLADLERTPRRVQLHHADLEAMIAWTMDEIFELAKSGGHKERKMELLALEHRARLVLERWKMMDVN